MPEPTDDEQPSVADLVDVLGEVYKQLALINRRLDALGAASPRPSAPKTSPVTLVPRKG